MPGPVVIATWPFGRPAAEETYRGLASGDALLDAIEAGINLTELDPEVTSVGYGGMPNAAGVVELDAAIMDGPGHRAGSIAAIQQIRTPISVARRVMELCPHVMLVGDGALDFAVQHGFPREETLTEKARAGYEDWIAGGRPRRWLGGADPTGQEPATGTRGSAEWESGRMGEGERNLSGPSSVLRPPSAIQPPSSVEIDSHDTIGLAALDGYGRLAVGCSTSGLAFKEPGRVGDSPIIGAGLYVDQAVGAASATGVGELILRFSLSHLIVEEMRRGASPQEACRTAILRVVETDARYAELQVGVIALDRHGRTGAASTRPPQQHALTYAIADSSGSRLLDAEIAV